MAQETADIGFDYGTDKVVEASGTFKQPEVGDHTARLQYIFHLGMFCESFKGKKKKPAPQVVAVFQLKDETDLDDDGVTPLTLHKSFPLKKGDKAFMPKFIKWLDPAGTAKGFDDLIGAACTVNAAGSEKLNDDGTPKYVNFGGMAGLPAKFAKMVEPLDGSGSGHVRFEDLTKEHILLLNPILEVANILMKGEEYKGSKAEAIVNEIRKENPKFAVPTKEDEQEASQQSHGEVPPNLDENQEFAPAGEDVPF